VAVASPFKWGIILAVRKDSYTSVLFPLYSAYPRRSNELTDASLYNYGARVVLPFVYGKTRHLFGLYGPENTATPRYRLGLRDCLFILFAYYRMLLFMQQ
jgi:hypothetical protein